ncbi:MAG TPA: MarR family transcriptional regulator [Spirochaetia bacterium]|nr:MarR family transcriptional regulator [Spirochaetia bacterium]
MDDLVRSREALIQALGRQSAFWGLGRTAGEMYAALYLSPGSLSLEEVAQSLGVTKGNVSVAIRQLEQLGMVRRSWQKGDRRVFFEAETDFWKIAHSVLGLRHKPQFDQSFALVEESARCATQAGPSPERDTVVERLSSLQEFYRLLDSVVEGILAMSPGQLKAAVEMFKLVASGKKE